MKHSMKQVTLKLMLLTILLISVQVFQGTVYAAGKIVTKEVPVPSGNAIDTVSYIEGSSKGILKVIGIPYVTSGELIEPHEDVNVTLDTGETIPSRTYWYNEGGYKGTLNRIDYDEETKSEPHEVPKEFNKGPYYNVITRYYDADGSLVSVDYSWGGTNSHPSVEINEDGYHGSIPAYNPHRSSGPTRKENSDGTAVETETWTVSYKGTLTKTVETPTTYYTGYYSGTVYGPIEDTREFAVKGEGLVADSDEVEGNVGAPTIDNGLGDPVNAVNGNFYTTDTDLTLNDVGFDLSVIRYYNSTVQDFGVLGNGWTLSSESTLELKNEGNRITIVRDGGKKKIYDYNSSDNYFRSTKEGTEKVTHNSDGTFTLFLPSRDSYIYNASGQLIQKLDANGNSQTLTYSGNRVTKIENSSGAYLTLSYSGNRVQKITDSTGRWVTYTYSGNNLTKVSYSSGQSVTYGYDSYGMTNIWDAKGQQYLKNQYDKHGRVIKQWDQDNHLSTFAYDVVNLVTTYENTATGYKTITQFNTDFEIEKITYQDGTYETFTYDALGNKTSTRNRKGITTQYEYDTNGNLLKMISPSPYNEETVFTYENDQIKTITKPNGQTITYTYDINGNMTEESVQVDESRQAITQYEYDTKGRLVKTTDPEGGVTAYEYDKAPLPVKKTDAENHVTTYAYDNLNRIVSSTTENGTTKYTYDADDNIIKQVAPNGDTTRLIYDAEGNLTKKILPEQYNENTDNGTGYTYSYDIMDNLIKEIDPLGNTQKIEYDPSGQISKVIQPNQYKLSADNGQGVKYIYDAEGRLIEAQNPSGQKSAYQYDALGNLIKNIDANQYDESTKDGKGNQYKYNELNQLVEVTNAEGNVTSQIVYDENGKVIKSIDGEGYKSGNSTETRYGTLYSYNLAGWVTERRVPKKEESGQIKYQITAYSYNLNGQVIQEKRSQEYVTEESQPTSWTIINYQYDKNGQTTQITDNLGAQIDYVYNSFGQTTQITRKINDQINSVTQYVYDNKGRTKEEIEIYDGSDLVGYEDGPVQSITTYTYDKNDNVVQIERANGDITYYEYDASNRLIKQTQEVKEDHLTFKNTTASIEKGPGYIHPGEEGEYQVIVNPDGQIKNININIEYDQRTFEFVSFRSALNGLNVDSSVPGKLKITSNGISKTESFKVGDVILRAKDSILGKGYIKILNSSTYENEQGNSLKFGEVFGKQVSINGPDVNKDGQVAADDLTEVARLDGITSNQPSYNPEMDLNADQIIDTNDLDYIKDWLFNVDKQNFETVDEPKITLNEENINFTVATNTVNRTAEYTYDANGNLKTKKDANGNITSYTYDFFNQLTGVKDAEGNQTTSVYDEIGNLIKEISPANQASGKGTRYVYDTNNRLVQVIDENDNVIMAYSYDENNRVLTETSGEGSILTYSYDIGGRIKAIRTSESEKADIDREAYTYDALDYVLTYTDGNGNPTTYERDAWGNAISQTNAEGVTSYYTFDQAGNCTSIKDEKGHITHYTYNSLNQVSSVTDPLGQSTYYAYDLLGRMIEETDRNGDTIHYTYTADDTLRRQENQNTQDYIDYYYQKDGSVLGAANNDGIDTYEYDSLGRITLKKHNGKTAAAYSYNADGQVSKLKDITGKTTEYTYTQAGQLEKVYDGGSLLASYNYDKDYRVKDINFANGQSQHYNYDGDSNIIGISSSNNQGDTIDNLVYAYDNNDNLLSMVDGEQTTSYTYDPLNRLKTVDYPSIGQESFEYDLAGNRSNHTRGQINESYTYDANNRMTQITGTQTGTFTYDKNGNLSQETLDGESTSYTYNGFNQLTGVKYPDESLETMGYDPSGIRSTIEYQNQKTQYLTAGGNILATIDYTGQVSSRYVRGLELLKQEQNDTSYTYHHNAHGDITKVLDEQGTIVNSYTYDAFGNTLSQVEGIDNIYKYAGQQYDERLGQYYLRARYYDPVFGRFTQEDTYRGDGNNLYAYVKNNPLKYVDPSGHRSEGKDCGDIGYKGTLDSIMQNTGSANVDKLNQALLLPTAAGTSIVGNNSLDSLVKMLTILTMMGSYQSMDSIIGYSPDSFADNITNPIGTIMDKIFHAETNDGDEVEAKSDDEGTVNVQNSAGQEVERRYVNSQEELLNAAEEAAGGSLDDYNNYKEHWWESPDGSRRIEWNPDGHANTNEGPHVTVRDYNGRRHSVTEKIFIEGWEQYNGK